MSGLFYSIVRKTQRHRWPILASTVVPLRQPDAVDDPLTAILRSGAWL